MQSDKAASYWMKAKLTETHVTSKFETNEHTSAQPTASERGSSESIKPAWDTQSIYTNQKRAASLK